MSDLLRIYDPRECGSRDGYPLSWHRCAACLGDKRFCAGCWRPLLHGDCRKCEPGDLCRTCDGAGSIKDLVRGLVSHRCIRCGHPYRQGEHGNGEWSPCDERCTHDGPLRVSYGEAGDVQFEQLSAGFVAADLIPVYSPEASVEARWRILTVHHLTGVWGNEQEAKRDCRWWNLAALCQRCHLRIQGKVDMAQVWPHEHSPWFRVNAAGYYASVYEGRDITRDEAEARMEELLSYERAT